MKHSNQDNVSRNHGTTTDQNKKANKTQEHERNAGAGQGDQSAREKNHSADQAGSSSNWQKDKQGNKK